MGHAAECYHRIDSRQSSRNLVVRHRERIIADTNRPLVLYQSGFAPRWYVTRANIDESAVMPVEHQTFCPYKGRCSHYDLVSFEPDVVSVQLDGVQLHLAPGQTVIAHGPDRDLDIPAAIAP
jgi:uncharacterized protein (DUF427 family)